jgi:hypothetical protein
LRAAAWPREREQLRLEIGVERDARERDAFERERRGWFSEVERIGGARQSDDFRLGTDDDMIDIGADLLALHRRTRIEPSDECRQRVQRGESRIGAIGQRAFEHVERVGHAVRRVERHARRRQVRRCDGETQRAQ